MAQITYTMRENGLLYPDLTLPEEPIELGALAMKHKDFIRNHRRGRFALLVIEGRMNEYLAEVEQRATAMLEELISQMAQQQGVTEQLKAQDQMSWIQKMNNIRNAAMEIVNSEIIYS